MNTLATLRSELSAALASTDLRVMDHLPERIVPPLALIAAGNPYVGRGNTFGSFEVRFTVVLVCSQSTNQVATNELDDAVTTTLVALDNADWNILRVDQPTMLAQANTHYLSTTVDVARTVTGIQDGRD